MATTTVRVLCYAGTAKVYLTDPIGDASGTPDAGGYTPTQVEGLLHTISVTEALVGRFRWVGGTSDVASFWGWVDMVDEAVTIDGGTGYVADDVNVVQVAGQTASATGTVDFDQISGANISIIPLTGVVESRTDGTTINVFTGETPTISITAVNAAGDSVDVSALTLSVIIEDQNRTDVAVIADGDITKSSATFSFAAPAAITNTEGLYKWSVRNDADGSVLMHGPFIVTYEAEADS